jgi:hypothetical protein
MRLGICLFAVVACKTAAPVAPRPAGPPYSPLFQLDRAWSLPAEIETGHKQGERYVIDHAARGVLNCKTGNVRAVGEATLAHLACDPPLSDVLAAGTWVSTPTGLFHPSVPIEDAEDVSNLGEGDLMIAATPAERHHARVVSRMEETTDAFEFGGGWCVRDRSSATAEARREFTLCFDGNAVTGGEDLLVLAGQWRRSRYGQAPSAPDAPITE